MITVDREEFQIKLDEINSLVSRKEYKAALEIVNSIDWRRVKNVRTLCMVGEIYAVNKKYSESREIFLLAYHRSQVGKTILYRLVEVSLKMKDFKEAQEYYEEFVRIAPKDNIRYILQYKIAAAKNVPLEKQIQILEKHKEKEMTERWSYELAKLYYKADNYQKCIEACDDLVIWFRDGKYVIRALELKMKLTELTPSQQEIYEENLHPPVQEKEKTAENTTQEKKEAVVRDEKPQKIEISVQKDKPKKRKFKKAEAPAEEAIPKTEEAIDWEAILKKGESEKEQVVAEEAAPEETAPEKTETPDWEAILKKGESETEENSNEEEASIGDERNFQKKITAGIRDIFKRHFKPAEEDIYKPEEELKVMYTAGKINYSDVIPERVLPDDVPALEPEIIREEPIVESVAQPKKVEEVPELEPEVMKEEPAVEPEAEIIEEEPVEEPETEIVEEEPIEEPETEIIEEEPVEEPETEIIEEEPAEEPEDIEKPVEETQVIPEIPKLNIPKVNVNETAKVEDLPIEDKLSFNLEDTILAAAAKQGIPVPEKSSEEVEPEPEDEAEELMEQPVEVYVEETIEEELPEEETVEEIIEEELPEEETVEEIIEEQLPEEEIVEEIIEEQLPEEETVEEIIEEQLPEEETMEAQPELEPEPEFSEEEALLRFIDEHSSGANAKNRELIPREAVLDDEEQKLFKYFSSIPGMEKQLVDVLMDTQMAAADFTSSTGNVIIMGNRESGKTTLSELLVKAICRELKIPAAKIAKVTAQQLNGKDIGKIVAQLSGGFLLIQDMNQMDAETVEALNQAMETPTEGLTVIIEDEKIGMRKFIARNPKLIEKFTSRIAIPVFTNDELVNFAKIYTNEAGYKIDEMGILALYSLISDNQKEDEPMTVGGVKRLVDDAISKAESGTRKLQRNLSKSRLDRDGFVILYEKDFK